MFAPLALKDATPLVAGSRRYVFQHPADPDLLVKVLKLEKGRQAPLLGIRRPNEMLRSFRREIAEFLRVRLAIPGGPLPIARVYGIAETDLGTGLMVERISAPDGGLAPSLKAHVARHGYDAALEGLILSLRDILIHHNVVAGDINTNNVVVAPGRLVVVDGIGDKTFIPVNSLSARVNRRSLERRFARVVARLKALDSRR